MSKKYTPFDEQWRKELMKFRKDQLIDNLIGSQVKLDTERDLSDGLVKFLKTYFRERIKIHTGDVCGGGCKICEVIDIISKHEQMRKE